MQYMNTAWVNTASVLLENEIISISVVILKLDIQCYQYSCESLVILFLRAAPSSS